LCVVDSDVANKQLNVLISVKMAEPRDDATTLSSEDVAVGDPDGGANAMHTG